jgi:hypothetical protein
MVAAASLASGFGDILSLIDRSAHTRSARRFPIGTVSADAPVYPALRRSHDSGVGAELSIKDGAGDCLVHTTVMLGHSILVLEDASLIALECTEALRRAGASVFSAHSVRDALPLASLPYLSAATVDFRLRDCDAGAVCERVNASAIPFVLYTGYRVIKKVCRSGTQVPRPSRSSEPIATVIRPLH